jgi:hypothetical protein
MIKKGKYDRLDMKHTSIRAEHMYHILAGIPKGRNHCKTFGNDRGDIKMDTED